MAENKTMRIENLKQINDLLKNSKLNYVGLELLFHDDNAEVVSDEFINQVKKENESVEQQKEITKEKLIDHFTGYLPLELLLAFQNETVVTLGLLNNLNQEIKNPKIKKRTLYFIEFVFYY